MPSSKTQDHAAVEKPHTKPGRKPLTSEPKNKRTAQNRAAQRAFRERKEKRMQELEDKVLALEQEKVQIANESELLRIQVKSLMSQLGRHRKGSNGAKKSPGEFEKDDDSSIRRDSSSDEKSTNNISSNSSVSSATPVSFASEEQYNFPKALAGTTGGNTATDYSLNLANKMNNKSFKDHYDEQVFCKELGEVCGSTSCPFPKAKPSQSSSASPATILSNQNHSSSMSVTSNGMFTGGSSTNMALPSTSSMTTPSVDFSARSSNTKSPFSNSLFEESINGDLNILGDVNKDEFKEKEDSKVNNNSIWNVGKGLDSYAFLDSNKNNNEMDFLFNDEKKNVNGTNNLIQSHPEAFQLDANSSLFNNNLTADLDAEVDFENDDVFDDLLKLPYDDINFNNQLNDLDGKLNDTIAKGNGEGADIDSDDEKVPDTTQNLMKCSQIWERITTHPRFTDLDIDNLCDELKLKAKCSESGVVVDGGDVGKLLHQATCEKQIQKEKEKEREMAIKRAVIGSNSTTFLNGFW